MQDETETWIAAAEAAKRLGVTKDRIYDDVHHKRLRKQPDAKRLKVCEADVEALLTRQAQNAAAAETEDWVTTPQLARMFRMTVKRLRKQTFYHSLTRKLVNGNRCYFRIKEAEAVLRDPDRLRRETNRERLRPLEKALAARPADAIDIPQAARVLAVSTPTVLYLIKHGVLARYRAEGKRSKYWLSAEEVEARREKRQRQREEKEDREAFPAEKLPPPRTKLRRLLPRGKRVGVGDLSEWEWHFGDWITTRQAAWMLNVTMNVVYALRRNGRLTARKETCWFNRREQWHFRKTDVTDLMNDLVHMRGRGAYANRKTPEQRAAQKEAEFRAQLDACEYADQRSGGHAMREYLRLHP